MISRTLPNGLSVRIDARATDRFDGRNEPADPIAGHVPGARSHPLTLNLDTDGRFFAPDELRRLQALVNNELQKLEAQ